MVVPAEYNAPRKAAEFVIVPELVPEGYRLKGVRVVETVVGGYVRADVAVVNAESQVEILVGVVDDEPERRHIVLREHLRWRDVGNRPERRVEEYVGVVHAHEVLVGGKLADPETYVAELRLKVVGVIDFKNPRHFARHDVRETPLRRIQPTKAAVVRLGVIKGAHAYPAPTLGTPDGGQILLEAHGEEGVEKAVHVGAARHVGPRLARPRHERGKTAVGGVFFHGALDKQAFALVPCGAFFGRSRGVGGLQSLRVCCWRGFGGKRRTCD